MCVTIRRGLETFDRWCSLSPGDSDGTRVAVDRSYGDPRDQREVARL